MKDTGGDGFSARLRLLHEQFEDFRICAVEDFGATCYNFAEFFDQIPCAEFIEFIGMPPEVEHLRLISAGLDKGVGEIEQLWICVAAG